MRGEAIINGTCRKKEGKKEDEECPSVRNFAGVRMSCIMQEASAFIVEEENRGMSWLALARLGSFQPSACHIISMPGTSLLKMVGTGDMHV